MLIDWSQNDARKTTVCVYSLRATERPSVSTPLQWEEVRAALDSGDPRAPRVRRPGRCSSGSAARGDLFAAALSLVQTLPELNRLHRSRSLTLERSTGAAPGVRRSPAPATRA